MRTQFNKLLLTSFFLSLLLLNATSFGQAITVNIAKNTVANADFREGEKDKPAVFLLHGFMSTYNLNIIQIIAEELGNNGYTVLAPTLSLNINNRRSALNCDAIHTHSMDSDVDEIGRWVGWLKDKGYKEIIMAGFSTGALQISIYLSRHKPDIIKKAILISPAYLTGAPYSTENDKTEIAAAKKMIAANNRQLKNYFLSYCKGNFTAPPDTYLSYKKWTDVELINVIKKIPVPNTVFIGGKDHRFTPRIASKLKMIKANVIKIPEANHFYDSPHEFEFLDKLTKELATR